MNVVHIWITAIKNEGVIIHLLSFVFCHLHALAAIVSEPHEYISQWLLHRLFPNNHTEALQNEALITEVEEKV